MKHILLSILILSCVKFTSFSYDVTIPGQLHVGNSFYQDLNPYLLYYRTPFKNVPTDSIVIKFNKGDFREWDKDRLNQFYNDDHYWFCFSIKCLTDKQKNFLLRVKGKGYSVCLYKLDNLNKQLVTIDSASTHTPIGERNEKFRLLTFNINVKDTAREVIFLKVQKTMVRNAIFKFHIFDQASYLQAEMKEQLIMFLYIGFFVIALIFHLLLFAVFRESLHGWQTIYISFSLIFTIYLFDFHVYLIPNGLFPTLSSIPTVILPYICVMTLIVVYMHLLNTPAYPIVHKALQFTLAFSGFSILCSIISYILYFNMIELKFRPLDNLLRIPTFLNFLIYEPILLISSIYLFNRVSLDKRFFLVAVVASMFFWLLTFTEMAGKTDITIIPPNNMVATYGIEIMVFLLITIYKFWGDRKEKHLLMETKLNLQKKLVDDVVKAEEQERKRIAQELHDGLGGYLMGIRLMVNRQRNEEQNEASYTLLKNIEEKLDKAVGEVRAISHNLMPDDFKRSEFTATLKDHLNGLNENGSITFEYFFDEKLNTLEKSIQITSYRILSELIKNIQSHAQATAATIQIVVHPKNIIIHVEDNGIGFDIDRKRNGIGLRSIQLRIEYLKGKMNVESGKLGTNIIIEMPVNTSHE